MTTRKPRNLKRPQSCRYCGFVAITHVREGRGGAAGAVVSYSCRNADECGARIRENKAKAGIPADTSDLPF